MEGNQVAEETLEERAVPKEAKTEVAARVEEEREAVARGGSRAVEVAVEAGGP